MRGKSRYMMRRAASLQILMCSNRRMTVIRRIIENGPIFPFFLRNPLSRPYRFQSVLLRLQHHFTFELPLLRVFRAHQAPRTITSSSRHSVLHLSGLRVRHAKFGSCASSSKNVTSCFQKGHFRWRFPVFKMNLVLLIGTDKRDSVVTLVSQILAVLKTCRTYDL